MSARLDTLHPGDRFTVEGTTRAGRVVYVVPGMRVRVRWDGVAHTVTLPNGRTFVASGSKLDVDDAREEIEP